MVSQKIDIQGSQTSSSTDTEQLPGIKFLELEINDIVDIIVNTDTQTNTISHNERDSESGTEALSHYDSNKSAFELTRKGIRKINEEWKFLYSKNDYERYCNQVETSVWKSGPQSNEYKPHPMYDFLFELFGNTLAEITHIENKNLPNAFNQIQARSMGVEEGNQGLDYTSDLDNKRLISSHQLQYEQNQSPKYLYTERNDDLHRGNHHKYLLISRMNDLNFVEVENHSFDGKTKNVCLERTSTDLHNRQVRCQNKNVPTLRSSTYFIVYSKLWDAEIFAEALSKCNIGSVKIAYTTVFPSDCRMFLLVPVYEGGYINRQDQRERIGYILIVPEDKYRDSSEANKV